MNPSWCLSRRSAFEYFKRLARKLGLSVRHDAGWYANLRAVFKEQLTLDNFRYGLYVIRKYATLSKHVALKGPKLWGYDYVISKSNWRFYTGDYMPKLYVHDYDSLSVLRDDVKKYEAVMMNLGFAFVAPNYVLMDLRHYAFSHGINFIYRRRCSEIVAITRDRVDELYQQALDSVQKREPSSSANRVTKFFLSPTYELTFFMPDGIYFVKSRSVDFISQYISHPEEGVCAYCGFPFSEQDTPIQFSLYYVRRGHYKFIRSGYVHKGCIQKMQRSKGLLKLNF